MIVDGLGSSEAGGQLPHVSTGTEPPPAASRPARQPRAVGRPGPARCSPGRRRGRVAGQERAPGPRLPRRRREDGAHVPGGRRRALRRPGDRARSARRRHDRAARARRRDDQLGRREDLRRGGRDGRQGPPGGVRLRRRRPAERALGQRGRGHRPPPRRRRRPRRTSCSPPPPRTSPATSCPRAIVFVDEIVRSPSGKADYRWARQVAAARPSAATIGPVGHRSLTGDADRPAGTARRCPRATRSGRRCATCSTPSPRATTSSTGS